jgi:hypothetical protein
MYVLDRRKGPMDPRRGAGGEKGGNAIHLQAALPTLGTHYPQRGPKS